MARAAQRDFDAAIGDYTKVIELNAYHADAYYARGLAQHKTGNFDAAISDFTRATEIIPPVNRAYLGKATSLKAKQQWAPAEDSYRQALRLAPNDPLVLNNVGYFLVEQNKDLSEALGMIERAVKAEPTNSSFLDSLGWAYFKMGKLDEAERYLSEAGRLDGSSATSHEHLGDLKMKRGKIDLAHSEWSIALSLSTETETVARLKAKLNRK